MLLGAFTDFHTAESLFMVPLRGTQYTLSSAAPDSRKSFEAKYPRDELKNYRLEMSAATLPCCVKLRCHGSHMKDGAEQGWI